MFCRLPKQGYVYCGELGYRGHNADRFPMKFVWQLLDADNLKKNEEFKAIIKEGIDNE